MKKRCFKCNLEKDLDNFYKHNQMGDGTMESDIRESLIEEYKICDSTISRLDNLIWQMASILFPITLAGFAYFGISDVHTLNRLIVLVVVGSGSSILILNWYFLSRHWAAYQKVAIYRMREVERELGSIWLYRYSGFVRLSDKDRKQVIEESKNNAEIQRLRQFSTRFVKFPFYGLFRSMMIVSIVFIAGWIILILRETYLVLLIL